MATALKNDRTMDFKRLAIQAQQLKDNTGAAVDMTELTALSGVTSSAAELNTLDVSALSLGTVGTPASGTITVSHKAAGEYIQSTFTLAAARFSTTDSGASGSFGTLPVHTFPEGGVSFLGSRQNYSAIAESAAVDTSAGDVAYVIGLGTVAISAAADGVLATANKDIGSSISITNSAGTGAGTAHTGAGAVKDGTATAGVLNLNWSGTAATSDASGTIDVTGTITVLWAKLGDD